MSSIAKKLGESTPAGQMSLITEPASYHESSKWGFFSVVSRDPHRGMRQKSYPLRLLPEVLSAVPRDRDTYISQAEFTRPNRRVVNLARVGLMFVDIDPGPITHLDGEQWAMRCLMACKDEGVPAPSIIISSGRGVHMKWLLDRPLPRAAMPRWNHAQKCLVKRFEHIGADAGARDASRVLRLEGTRNQKSDRLCRVVWEDRDPCDRELVRHSFDVLFDELVDVPRHIYEAQQDAAETARRERQKHCESFTLVRGGKYGLRRLGDRQLAWDRLEDLRILASMRAGHIEGSRMLFLFWCTNFLALAQPTKANTLHYEARSIAREIAPGWTYQDCDLGTTFRRAKAYAEGEKVEFNGRQYPPLYTPRNDTLIQALGITDAEQHQLKTIISKGEAAARHADRETLRRRLAGVAKRSEYLANVASTTEKRRQTALKMREEGKTNRDIAEAFSIHPKSVSRLLRG
ncbi:helix-turn-helix domain-containing protein [Halomonas sp. AOP35-4E-18]|uniref:helix-turn-helix domain-containing protein n=1 Tax=Halomonas sp. AOP35-4E-18 TaxID=3457686 RepID=UPI004034DC38